MNNLFGNFNDFVDEQKTKFDCRNLPGELNNLCKQTDIPKPLKYIIITLYDYLTLPMNYWSGTKRLGEPCTGGVNDYVKDSTPSIIYNEHDSKLEKLKNSLKNKIIKFFTNLDKKAGITTEIIENHVKNIINAEEKTIIDLKENRYRIPSFCKSSAGHSKYQKQSVGLDRKYLEVWKFDKQEGIKQKFEYAVTWFKLNGKRQFIKEIFENEEEMPKAARKIFKKIIDEKTDEDIGKIINVTNNFIYEPYGLEYKLKDYHSDEVLIKWIKRKLDVYTPPEVVNEIRDKQYDNYVEWLAKKAKEKKRNKYSAQYNLKF